MTDFHLASRSTNTQTVIKRHILVFSPFSHQKSLAPCLHHSKLKVDGDHGLTFSLPFQLLKVFSSPWSTAQSPLTLFIMSLSRFLYSTNMPQTLGLYILKLNLHSGKSAPVQQSLIDPSQPFPLTCPTN